MITLFDDQKVFITDIARLLSKVRKPVAQLPTGGGKTVIFSAICQRFLLKNPGQKILILVHRKELLEQTRKTCYNAFGITCEPIVAGMKFIPDAEVYVGMVESVSRRIDKLPSSIGLVIIDECHRLEFVKLHEFFPTQYILGFTATPLTASKKKPLKMFYDDIVCGSDIPDLIKLKRLSQNITWAPKETVDRLQLEIDSRKGDFDEHFMAEQFGKAQYVNNTVNAYEKWAAGKKTIVFNVNIEHSEKVAAAFTARGYDCKQLDSNTLKHERKQILHWFHTTPGAILCNVGIATTGFDEPTIECVMVNKATMSLALWLQMCGRGSRIIERLKYSFTIIDMGGNAITHGDWCQARNWKEIFYNPPKPGKDGVAPVKACPKCDGIIAAAARVCPLCGYVFPEKEIAIEADLHEFIVVTKNIDVAKIAEENKMRKKYYPVFKLGNDLAIDAKNTIPKMQDDYATFILQKYNDLVKEFLNSIGKKYSAWWQTKAHLHLYEQLNRHFPKWELPPDIKKQIQADKAIAEGSLPIDNVKNIEGLKGLHYS